MGFAELAIGALKEIRNSDTSCKPIPWDTLSQLYLATLEEIGRVYPGPAIWDDPEVRSLEDMLNQTWLACLRGEISLEGFETALNEWEEEIYAQTF